MSEHKLPKVMPALATEHEQHIRESRLVSARAYCDPVGGIQNAIVTMWAERYVGDAEALLAEVDRLRRQLAESEALRASLSQEVDRLRGLLMEQGDELATLKTQRTWLEERGLIVAALFATAAVSLKRMELPATERGPKDDYIAAAAALRLSAEAIQRGDHIPKKEQ